MVNVYQMSRNRIPFLIFTLVILSVTVSCKKNNCNQKLYEISASSTSINISPSTLVKNLEEQVVRLLKIDSICGSTKPINLISSKDTIPIRLRKVCLDEELVKGISSNVMLIRAEKEGTYLFNGQSVKKEDLQVKLNNYYLESDVGFTRYALFLAAYPKCKLSELNNLIKLMESIHRNRIEMLQDNSICEIDPLNKQPISFVICIDQCYQLPPPPPPSD